MTVTPNISVNDGKLVVHGKTILTGVPDNVVLTPGSGRGLMTGAFVGATASRSKSLHVFPMGVLEGLRFMCCFRFKLWWMTQRMGTCGKDVPLETQFMLIESKESEGQGGNLSNNLHCLLPLLEGQFRAVLQGNDKNEIEICLESGDNAVETTKLPSFLDWFGWCTWDAFYTDVTAEGVEEGLK
ncbi:Glycosyl hydrolases 36, partial [Sesbania bispinosa]